MSTNIMQLMNPKTLAASASAVLIAALAWCLAGAPAYRHHRESLALRAARQFAARGDYRNASLSAQRAQALNPRNAEACGLLGQLTEPSDPEKALEWYRRSAELSPTIDHRLEVAAKALRFQQPPYPLAAAMLEELAEAAKCRVSYCVLCAELALKLGKTAEAERWFEAAHTLEPTNQLHQVNLAMLRLNSTNPATALAARSTLGQMRSNDALSGLALRALTGDAIARCDFAAAAKLSNELAPRPDALWEDQLQHLEILQSLGSEDFGGFLAGLQERTVTNGVEMSSLASWMVVHAMGQNAASWLTNAPAALRENSQVRLATAECLLAIGDWPAAEAFLRAQAWGELEAVRLGLLSRVAMVRQDDMAAGLHWRLAVNAAQKRLGSLVWLAAKAREWGRDTAAEEVLWRIAEQFPRQRWALQELAERALAKGSTRDLHRVYCRMALEDPQDPQVQNNLAATRLLLRTDLERAHEEASELYARHPGEPVIASTYAYSLHLQQRAPEGLAALQQLSSSELRNPGIALYYGILLRANGDTEGAREFLKLAESARMLPEERQLLAESLEGLIRDD